MKVLELVFVVLIIDVLAIALSNKLVLSSKPTPRFIFRSSVSASNLSLLLLIASVAAGSLVVDGILFVLLVVTAFYPKKFLKPSITLISSISSSIHSNVILRIGLGFIFNELF